MTGKRDQGCDLPRTKIVIIGESGVGKSSIVGHFLDPKRSAGKKTSTIGVETRYKIIQCEDTAVKIEIWDTAGQERYRSMIRGFFHNAKGVMMVFDLGDPQSLARLTDWFSELENSTTQDTSKIIVGSKMDLPFEEKIAPEIIAETIKDLTRCHRNIIGYVEVSALTGKNVEEAFYTLAQDLVSKSKFLLTQNVISLRAKTETSESETEHINPEDLPPKKGCDC